jgi:hypothetical protein
MMAEPGFLNFFHEMVKGFHNSSVSPIPKRQDGGKQTEGWPGGGAAGRPGYHRSYSKL